MKNRPSRHQFDAPSGAGKVDGSEPAEAIVLVVPEPELAKAEGASEQIQRWEDDGGPVSEAQDLLPLLP